MSFDLDGTLLPTATVAQFPSDRLGHSGPLRELEDRFAQGTVSNVVFADLSAPAYAGMRRREVWPLLERAVDPRHRAGHPVAAGAGRAPAGRHHHLALRG